jgi:diaminopimelate decarboxylase
MADVDRLNKSVWPASASFMEKSGELVLSGITASKLIADYGTPAFILDEVDFRSRATKFRDAMQKFFGTNANVYYASKAFTSIATCKWLAEDGLNLDVCTGGELAVALAAKFPADRIELHGNNKSLAEIEEAITVGVRYIVADSLIELDRINSIAGRLGKKQSVLIRLTPGISAHTHESIATAHEDVKFGFSIASGAAMLAAVTAINSEHISLEGVHCHIGSQIFDDAGFILAIERLVKFIADVKKTHNYEVHHLDVGGGFGIAYTESDDPMDVEQVLEKIHDALVASCKKYEISLPSTAIEPGRAIVGPAMVTLYQVGTVKDVVLEDGKTRTYISVDGGMSDNIRPSLYGAEYSALLANRISSAPLVTSRLVGKHCESGDIIIRDIALPSDIVPGDVLAIPATGAYGRSMASNYNHILRPPVIAVRDGKSRTIIRREKISDLLALEEG